MLWVDKYRPNSLEKLDIHPELTGTLKLLVEGGDFPHILFYGPSGVGKKTRVNCILKELFGAGVEKLKVDHRTFSYGASGSVEISLVVSNHHIELNPSDAGFHDRIVVQELIKEIAMSHPLDATINRSFKVVVLNDVDRLSKEAQHSLRRNNGEVCINMSINIML